MFFHNRLVTVQQYSGKRGKSSLSTDSGKECFSFSKSHCRSVQSSVKVITFDANTRNANQVLLHCFQTLSSPMCAFLLFCIYCIYFYSILLYSIVFRVPAHFVSYTYLTCLSHGNSSMHLCM